MTDLHSDVAVLKSSIQRIEHAVCGRDGDPGLVRRVDRIEQRQAFFTTCAIALSGAFFWLCIAPFSRGESQ